jgi:hypothetical protein
MAKGIPPLIKSIKNEWTVHSSEKVRNIYRDGRIHAAMGHPREDCPYAGDVPQLRGQGQYRPGRSQDRLTKTLRRRAWLAGWDKETELMEKAAGNKSRRPVLDEDDV